ncbi:AaceriAEL085Wp [[Ashbya] aceris (nom. inval.)]|nr:AaceriAEL085Wp [[Ashbya] aceris (nom. inval.)]
MSSLEDKRAILEELEVIEDAISSRIERNPEIYYSYLEEFQLVNSDEKTPDNISKDDINANRIYINKKPRRSRKQLVLQQHEIALFLQRYRKRMKRLNAFRSDDIESLQDPDMNFEAFEAQIRDIQERHAEGTATESAISSLELKRREYSMFSASSGEDQTILSDIGQFIDVNKLFMWEEHYGEYLFLEQLHQEWLNVVKDGSVTLLQFITFLESFAGTGYLTRPPIDRNSKRYQAFIQKLVTYLGGAFRNTYPLLNHHLLENRISQSFKSYIANPVEDSPRGLLCVACGKHFKIATVFAGHLLGKKHSQNLSTKEASLRAEHTLHYLVRFLAASIGNTRALIERKYAFTSGERNREMATIRDAYHTPAYSPGEPEDVIEAPRQQQPAHPDDVNPLNLPLGPDGYPIPYWLYKLQGLDIEYSCEICGNHVYKGRRVFERHFQEQRHIYGLRCLGIEPSPAFKDIYKISEAQQLWHSLQSSTGAVGATARRTGATSSSANTRKLEVEVEDEDGNVMTRQVYEDLKKQGLL